MDDIIRTHRENVRHSAQKVVRRENWQDVFADFFKQFIIDSSSGHFSETDHDVHNVEHRFGVLACRQKACLTSAHRSNLVLTSDLSAPSPVPEKCSFVELVWTFIIVPSCYYRTCLDLSTFSHHRKNMLRIEPKVQGRQPM